MALLAVLLVLVLPRVQTEDNITARQGQPAPAGVAVDAGSNRLTCHVCEKEDDFSCTNPQTCAENQKYCVTAAIRMFPRFLLVSKQCSEHCGTAPDLPAKEFIMEEPTPFVYFVCCVTNTCNNEGGVKLQFKEHTDRASEVSRGNARLATFLAFVSIVGGFGLP
uniref:UPAR/Ly6 domain-containing protein n=1 Tax=Otolemur garnettii TaxID=30611 RepID=H0XND0_OTOGA